MDQGFGIIFILHAQKEACLFLTNDAVVFLNCYGADSRQGYGGIKCHMQPLY